MAFSRCWAQTPARPLALPTRDVAIIYEVTGAAGMDGAQKLQVTYADGGNRARVDYFRWREAKSVFAALIFGRPADRVLAVLPERHAYVEHKVGKIENPDMFLKPTMQFTRKGQDAVAGLSCTDRTIKVPDKDRDQGTACVTDDGVALRLTAGKDSVAALTATAVAYGAPSNGVFDPPAGYQRQVAE